MNRKQCIELIKRDVKKVMKYATAIIVIASDNKSFELIRNPNPRLGILAIIGTTNFFDQKFRPREISEINFDQAILMEIGLGPSRPYHKAKGINKKKYQPFIMKRRKWFCLTKKQYQLIAPFIFNFMIEKSLEKIKGWESKGYFTLPLTISKHYKGKITSYETRRDWPKGTRFAASSKDNFFIRDIITLAKNNSQIQRQIRGLYCFIEMELRYFIKRGTSPNSFKQSETAWRIKEEIRDINILSRGYILNKISKEKKQPFYNDLINIFGTKEIKPLTRKKIPSFFSEIGDVEIKIIVRKKRKIKRKIKRHYIVFEIFPHDLLTSEDFEEYESDIPF